MSNPYIAYFKHQAGTGIVGFNGVRYQKGHGFFGRILSNAIYPLLRFLGKKALTVGADIASDVVINKKNFKESAKERLNDAGVDIVKAGVKRVRDMTQEGGGIKRFKSTAKKSIKRLKTNKRQHNALAELLKNESLNSRNV